MRPPKILKISAFERVLLPEAWFIMTQQHLAKPVPVPLVDMCGQAVTSSCVIWSQIKPGLSPMCMEKGKVNKNRSETKFTYMAVRPKFLHAKFLESLLTLKYRTELK